MSEEWVELTQAYLGTPSALITSLSWCLVFLWHLQQQFIASGNRITACPPVWVNFNKYNSSSRRCWDCLVQCFGMLLLDIEENLRVTQLSQIVYQCQLLLYIIMQCWKGFINKSFDILCKCCPVFSFPLETSFKFG